MEYYQKVQGSSLDALKDDPQFKADLLWFFSGNRYGYSPEKIKERGLNGLLEDFTEHMRFQDTNEMTAIRDLSHIRDSKGTSDAEREAWGRLMLAWDNAEQGHGSGWTKAGDYIQAIASSPSTWAGVLTAGLGAPMTKLSSKAAAKGAQLMVRKTTQEIIARQAIAKAAAKETLPKAVLKGGALAAVPEAGLAYLHSDKQQKAREEAEPEYKRDPVAFWANMGLQTALGFGIGGVARGFKSSSQNKAIDLLQEHHVKQIQEAAIANQRAEEVLAAKKSNPFLKEIEALYRKRPLDEEMVASGMAIKEDVISSKEWIGSVSPQIMRRVAASVLTMLDGVKIEPGQRVTEAVGFALRDGKITSDTIRETLDKFKLSTEQFSNLFVAEFSQAGKTLNIGSQLSRAAKGKSVETLTSAFESLVSHKVVSTSTDELADLARAAKIDAGIDAVGWLRNFDAFRIGMLTSQLATTSANIGSSVARLGVDASDRFFDNLYSGRNPFKGVLSAVSGLSWNASQAELMYLMLSEEAPETVKRIFFNATRVELDIGSNSGLAWFTRKANFLNSAADYNFKQAIFYSSIDRQLMDLGDSNIGRNWIEFSKKNSDLSNMPEGFLEKARDDALKFTYQYGYENSDNVMGGLANSTISLSKKAPFLVTSLVPFPRYVANQLEFIHDYTPLINLMGPARELFAGAPTGGKTTQERLARGTTGALMFMSAYMLRASQEGTTGPLSVEDKNGQVISLERVAGPYNTMLVLADALYRYTHNLGPMSKEDQDYLAVKGIGETALEAAEAATGMGFAGFEKNLLGEVISSIENGEWTQSGQELLGDLIAGFTYPAAVVRDYVDQMDPDNGTKPFLRAAMRGDDVNLLAPLEEWSVATMRATKALPDVRWMQYLQSLDGETDIPLYNPFNPMPARDVDPFLKQVTGFTRKDEQTELQREMSRLGIKEWEAYSKRLVANPTIDLIVRMDLSNKLHVAFEESLMEDETYTSVTDPGQKAILLERWLTEMITTSKLQADRALEEAQTSHPRLFAGYVRNQYDINVKSSKTPVDTVVKLVTQGKYKTADDYISDAEDIPDELTRRQTIGWWIELMNKELE